jgi:glycosyltransferase involved in cell wall biosynthesis
MAVSPHSISNEDSYVTVLVPAYNAMPYLRECVESVLAQTHDKLELLIINDGSTDDTSAYLASIVDPRLRVISQENQGFVASLNTGLKQASHDWVARLDGDDVMRPDRLECQIRFLENHADYRAVSSNYRFVTENGRISKFIRSTKLKSPPSFNPLQDENLLHVGMLYNRCDVLAVGGYRNLLPAEDLDLWMRMSHTVKFAVIPTDLTYIRVLKAGLTTHNFLRQRIMWRYVKHCANCTRAGIPEPDLEQWTKENESLHRTKERNWNSGYHYRLAGISFLNGGYIKGIWHIMLSFCNDPITFFHKASGYLYARKK